MIKYYKDLTPYDFYGKEKKNILNVGWLDNTHDFSTGNVAPELVNKLLLLICETTDKIEYIKKRKQKLRKNFYIRNSEKLGHINITSIKYRGYQLCPFDSEKIFLKVSCSDSRHLVGMSEMCIPSVDRGILYCFPDMLAHYIQKHNYCPPKEFLESLNKFSLTELYDLEKEKTNYW